MMVAKIIVSLLASAIGVSSFSIPALNQPDNNLLPRQAPAPTPGCENTPSSRECWGEFDINTDFYTTIFQTGVTREYWLEVVDVPCAPDGYLRTCHTFNGTFPGPLITADWGDILKIHVTNNYAENGTSIHWHGIRQLGTGEFDGVPGTTQCPIAPQKTMTYQFHLSQYGTTWYHSHLSMQYADGLLGPLIINGPASANYEEDLGTLFLQDWNHEPIFALWDVGKDAVESLTTTLLNGTNTYDCTGSTDPNCLGTGKKLEVNVEAGKTYRLRLINVAVEAGFQFSIDGHNLTVISTDLVPITPFETDSVLIYIGQRYDVVFTANAGSGNFWIRGGWNTACAANLLPANMTGILRYDASSTADPTSVSTVAPATTCYDIDESQLVPVVELPFTGSLDNIILANLVLEAAGTTLPYTEWLINESNYVANWTDPTLGIIQAGGSTFPSDYNVFSVSNETASWAVFVMNNTTPVNHPLHMHGHDFWILQQSTTALWTGDTSGFTTRPAPTRRDVAIIPKNGFLAIAFQLDNPGAWIAHCHIAWHQSQGLAFQFVETIDKVVSSGAVKNWATIGAPICNGFDAYEPTEEWPQNDSGI